MSNTVINDTGSAEFPTGKSTGLSTDGVWHDSGPDSSLAVTAVGGQSLVGVVVLPWFSVSVFLLTPRHFVDRQVVIRSLLRSAVAGRIYKLCAKNTSNSCFDRTFMPC